jgi:epoxyqueuosine reductase
MPEWCLRFGIVPLADPTNRSSKNTAYTERLLALGLAQGIDRIGVAPAQIFQRARHELHERKQRGLHDTMQFTYRNPDRSTDPQSTVAGAQSIVVGALSYATEQIEQPGYLEARIARYAWSDFYDQLRSALLVIRDQLRTDGFRAEVVVDSNALVDREAAYLAGLGWYGKNANLLLPGVGSYFVLGSVVTDAALDVAPAPLDDGCGACKRCLDSCPTGAIVAPGVIDARTCLAWLIQKPGVFEHRFREALGNRIYGCDDCQQACPPTIRFSIKKPDATVRTSVSVLTMLQLSDSDLMTEVGQWYVADRNPVWVRRNLLIILGNIASSTDQSVRNVLSAYCLHEDPMLRAHAIWSAARLGHRDLVPITDESPIVQAELAQLPEVRMSEGI